MASIDLSKILDADPADLNDEERLVYNISKAQSHAQTALDLCYESDHCKRSLWYKMTLGRAQSILMSLLVRELGRKREDAR